MARKTDYIASMNNVAESAKNNRITRKTALQCIGYAMRTARHDYNIKLAAFTCVMNHGNKLKKRIVKNMDAPKLDCVIGHTNHGYYISIQGNKLHYLHKDGKFHNGTSNSRTGKYDGYFESACDAINTLAKYHPNSTLAPVGR